MTLIQVTNSLMLKAVFVTTSDNSVKDQDILTTGTVWKDHLSKELKLNKKSIKTKVRSTVKNHYEKNGVGLISCNDNGPVTLISNVQADLPLKTVKR